MNRVNCLSCFEFNHNPTINQKVKAIAAFNVLTLILNR